MRILFVIRDMITGGAGKQLALTANALSRKGHEVFIYTYFGGECQHKLLPDVKYIAQNPSPNSKIKEYLFSVPHIRRQMKEIKPDVAISWRCNAGCFTVLASIGLPLKTIFSERSDPYMETSLILKISAFVCGFSDGGVFQTEAVQRYYKRLTKKSVVIHNPFDSTLSNQYFAPFGGRKNEIVHIARMRVAQKRQDVMLYAFKHFLTTHPDYTLSFYGIGPDFDQVRTMSEKMGIDKNVVFHGDVVGAAEKIGNTKLLVLTSDYEGIPNVVMEAFAMGVPVVSTDCSPGGARVLIDNGENGFVVPIRDSLSIAKKMCEIVEDEALAEKFIEKGQEKLRCFAPERTFERWNKYLESLL